MRNVRYTLVPAEESPPEPQREGDYDRVLADFCEMNCESARVRIAGRTRSAIVVGLAKAVARARVKVRVMAEGGGVYLFREDRHQDD